MTRHFAVRGMFQTHKDNERVYWTACGRIVSLAQAASATRTTCQTCKNTHAWREASQ